MMALLANMMLPTDFAYESFFWMVAVVAKFSLLVKLRCGENKKFLFL
jgi:hypothetical protein